MARTRRGYRLDQSKLTTACNNESIDGSCATGCTELANAAGLPFSAVHKARCRQHRAADDVVTAIAEGLGVTCNDLK